MFYINVWLSVNDSAQVGRVRELLGQCARGSRAEDGCVRFEAYQSEADPKRFLLVEHWRTREDWEAHRARPTVQQVYIPQVLPLVTRDAHVCSMVE